MATFDAASGAGTVGTQQVAWNQPSGNQLAASSML
jgi:hypothetical protein